MQIKLSSHQPTLYLYSRVSTEKQTGENKFGLERQQGADKVNKTIQKFPLFPVIEFADPGLSAYKKEHLNKGKLGKFVELASAGKIAAGSILAMEKIDRFSRLGLTEATNIATHLLHIGIRIYTWEDNELYDKDDLPQAIKLALKLQGAVDYSTTISTNVIRSTEARIKGFTDGRRDDDKNRLAVNGVGSHVWWIDTRSGYIKKHDVYWDIARDIVSWILEGYGHQKIAEKLHEAGHIPPHKRKKWGVNLISRFHLGGQIIGHRNLTLDGVEYVHKNYYPALVTPQEYKRILEVKQRNRSGRNGKKTRVGLFVGFKKLRCGKCGRTINTFISKSGQPGETQRYKCAGIDDATIKCHSSTIEGKIFETALIQLVGAIVAIPPKKELGFQVVELEQELKKTIQDMQDYEQLMFSANSASRLNMMERLNQLGNRKLQQEKELDSLKTVPVADPFAINNIPSNIINYHLTEDRVLWRENFYSHIKAITAKISPKFVDFKIELYNGNVIHTAMIDNKYLIQNGDAHFDMFHCSDEFGGASAYATASRWVGEDRNGKTIELINVDSDVLVGRKYPPDLLHNIAIRARAGEDLFLN
jgi:DNA invertase Pin-like site-specific DNA recombinase